MNVLILGNASDAHAVHLKSALEQAGAIVHYWDTQDFPTQLQLSWQPHLDIGHLTLPDGKKLDLHDIHSVFWRNFTGVFVPPLHEPDPHNIALRDASSALRSFIQACPAHWVNSWRAYQFHQEKPLQLAKAKQVGVPIPATLISNDPDEVEAFAHLYNDVIFKPVYGGVHTQRVTAAHLKPERLQKALRLAPITIQEYVPGTNVRSYVIGNSVYTAEIRSDRLDFRADPAAQLIPLETPESVRAQCLTIARAFWLEWTAIDWRLTPTGDYVFLEANPSPMFIHFERQTGFPLSQELVNLLMS